MSCGYYEWDKKELKLADNITARFRWVLHETPDLSWMGEWEAKRPDEYFIDRVYGVFLGKLVEVDDIEVPLSSLKPADQLVDEDGWPTADGYKAARIQLRAMMDERKLWYDPTDDDAPSFNYDEERQVFYIDQMYAYQVLAKDLGRTCYDASRYCRYWKPSPNHVPHNPKNWEHVDEERRQAIIAEHGSLEAQDIQYAVQDWKRMEDYENQQWAMLGCIVDIFINGVEVARESLWGIESDCDKAYKSETEKEVLAWALESAKKEVDRFNKVAQTLAAADVDALMAVAEEVDA